MELIGKEWFISHVIFFSSLSTHKMCLLKRSKIAVYVRKTRSESNIIIVVRFGDFMFEYLMMKAC